MINIFMFFLGYVVLSTLLPVPFNEIETTNEKMIKNKVEKCQFLWLALSDQIRKES